MSDKRHEGGCNCGNLRYEIRGEPQAVVVCHCLNCQRQSGAAFSVNLIVTNDQFTFKGEPKIYADHDTESGKPVHRHFCGDCGSPILSLSDLSPDISVVKAGSLDERTGFEPQAQCWTDTAFSWGSDLFGHLPSSPRNPEMA